MHNIWFQKIIFRISQQSTELYKEQALLEPREKKKWLSLRKTIIHLIWKYGIVRLISSRSQPFIVSLLIGS